MKHCQSVTVQLVYKLQRIKYKGTGSILNAFSQDNFVAGCYNLIEECKDDRRSVKSSHSSLSSMKTVAWKRYLLVPLDSSKATTRG